MPTAAPTATACSPPRRCVDHMLAVRRTRRRRWARGWRAQRVVRADGVAPSAGRAPSATTTARATPARAPHGRRARPRRREVKRISGSAPHPARARCRPAMQASPRAALGTSTTARRPTSRAPLRMRSSDSAVRQHAVVAERLRDRRNVVLRRTSECRRCAGPPVEFERDVCRVQPVTGLPPTTEMTRRRCRPARSRRTLVGAVDFLHLVVGVHRRACGTDRARRRSGCRARLPPRACIDLRASRFTVPVAVVGGSGRRRSRRGCRHDVSIRPAAASTAPATTAFVPVPGT